MKLSYIYCMYTFRYPFAFKIGISNNPKLRAKQIEESMTGFKSKVYVIAQNKMYMAFGWEQAFHLLFVWCNMRFFINRKLSGHTEFFFIPFIPFGLIWVKLPELVNLIFWVSLIYVFCK